MKPSVLFLCTGNSCRSQMAEGWARHLWAGHYEFHSAGIIATGLNPNAVKVMAEAGVNIAHHQSKRLETVMNQPFDYVITVCDNAREACPLFPGKAIVLHRQFDDPPTLAAHIRDEDEALGIYRRVRDEIHAFIKSLPQWLDEQASGQRNQ